ncbi:MAG: RNA polymerase sigma factor [Candidatus Lambdaproteobacteria bacterium]|nr:RNA polymerase sigma factor [Candidatus Lambdaproteobacteria bacterium]
MHRTLDRTAAIDPAGAAPGNGETGGATDGELVRRALAGESRAFEGLVRRHGPRVQRTVRRHVPGDAAQDVVQEAFLRAYVSLANYRAAEGALGDWLVTLAVRASYDHWRARYRRREASGPRFAESHQAWAERVTQARSVEAFEEETARREAREVLQLALARLSPEERLVVSLVHLEGLSVAEAARQLGWSEINVKVRAHRSRRKLRTVLEPLLEPLPNRTPEAK